MNSTLITRLERENAITSIIESGLNNDLIDKDMLNELFTFYSAMVLFYERSGNMELMNQLSSEFSDDKMGFSKFLNTIVNEDGVKLFQVISTVII